MNKPPIVILVAEDDKDDQLLVKEALEESLVATDLRFVNDGVELLQYLRGQGVHHNNNPWPGIILLDLNMPRKDGREALAEIKNDRDLKRIPVVILTTSKAEEDKLHGYNLGAASYLTKPTTFNGLVEMMKTLGHYWTECVELPPENLINISTYEQAPM